MTHSELDGAYELYVLGVLEPEISAEIDEHLGDQCAYCLERLHDAVMVTSAMAGIAEPQRPPEYLRDRVLASVTPQRARSKGWIYGLALAAAASIALLAVLLSSASTVSTLRAQLASLQQERDELRSVVAILSRPETRTAQFGTQENAAHGRVFLSRTGGVVFVASNLPALNTDRTFELWYIPAKGNPQPAGLFRPNDQGQSVRVWPPPTGGLQVAAVAVTIEPERGSPAPTTTPILVVPMA